MRFRPYQKLIVWQQAHALCMSIYKATVEFPSDEKFRLADQVRRAATSVVSNIVEGASKKSTKERDRFYETAVCSLEETHYQCFLARELGYFTDEALFEINRKIESTGFLLSKLRKALRNVNA